MSKQPFNVVSFSGGKDSTAMLLRMIEQGIKIDCILFCDTGLEFPGMYKHINKLEEDIGIPITRVACKNSFEYLMFETPVKRKDNTQLSKKYGYIPTGYGWPGPRMRWCTSKLKDGPRDKFLRELRKKYDVFEYIGIAADEQYRLDRERNKNKNHIHPLVDWNMTEADCLKFCYDRGYDWSGLYKHFHRVSCWCCPLQSLSELRQLYKHYPQLWNKLKEWDKQTWRSFRADYSVEELEVRFDFENKCLQLGKKINGKQFFEELRQQLGAMQSE